MALVGKDVLHPDAGFADDVADCERHRLEHTEQASAIAWRESHQNAIARHRHLFGA